MATGRETTDVGQALRALERATIAFANADADSTRTLGLALDLIIDVTGADAGAIAVPGDSGGPPVFLAERSLSTAGPVSRTVLEDVLQRDRSEVTITEPPPSQSVISAGITSILCTPVRRHGKTLAAVYLDRRVKAPFDDVAVRLASVFASVLALVLDLTRQRESAEQQAEEAREAAAHLRGFWRFGEVATENQRFAECLQMAERAAGSDATVLLLGETGVGKEHLARGIHGASSRRNGPFIAVNCAAIPETLLESELFGHEKGAFTGAAQARRGKFELAHRGTLFFDEIGELPLAMQPKLLRALDDKRFARLGSEEEKPVDVRIIAATNRDLTSEVRDGRFREDLYYRLHVVTMTLPPLRERVEDIPGLARHFLELESRRAGRELRWSDTAVRALSRHSWPGNVRELRNVIEKLCVLVPRSEITARDVEALGPGSPAGAAPAAHALKSELEEAGRVIERLQTTLAGLARLAHGGGEGEGSTQPFRDQLDQAARKIIERAVRQEGSIRAAASALGLSRQHLYLKCKNLGLEIP